MNPTRVLFVCGQNSARSQMAEALLTQLAGDRYEVHSAGLEPAPVNPLAVAAMAAGAAGLAGCAPAGGDSTAKTEDGGHIEVGEPLAEVFDAHEGANDRLFLEAFQGFGVILALPLFPCRAEARISTSSNSSTHARTP